MLIVDLLPELTCVNLWPVTPTHSLGGWTWAGFQMSEISAVSSRFHQRFSTEIHFIFKNEGGGLKYNKMVVVVWSGRRGEEVVCQVEHNPADVTKAKRRICAHLPCFIITWGVTWHMTVGNHNQKSELVGVWFLPDERGRREAWVNH